MGKKSSLIFPIMVVMLLVCNIVAFTGMFPNRSGHVLNLVAAILLLVGAIHRVIQVFRSNKN